MKGATWKSQHVDPTHFEGSQQPREQHEQHLHLILHPSHIPNLENSITNEVGQVRGGARRTEKESKCSIYLPNT